MDCEFYLKVVPLGSSTSVPAYTLRNNRTTTKATWRRSEMSISLCEYPSVAHGDAGVFAKSVVRTKQVQSTSESCYGLIYVRVDRIRKAPRGSLISIIILQSKSQFLNSLNFGQRRKTGTEEHAHSGAPTLPSSRRSKLKTCKLPALILTSRGCPGRLHLQRRNEIDCARFFFFFFNCCEDSQNAGIS